MNDFRNKVGNLLGTALGVFGEPIIYERVGGGSRTITAVFDNTYEMLDPETHAVISSSQSRLGVRLSDLEAPPEEGDRITRENSSIYEVKECQEDGQGGAYLFLRILEDAPTD